MGLSTGSLEDKACISSGGAGVCLPTGIQPPVSALLILGVGAAHFGLTSRLFQLGPGHQGTQASFSWPSGFALRSLWVLSCIPDTLPRMAMAEGKCGVHGQFQTRG